MFEVKADALEASFEALERESEDLEALKGEMAALKARVDAQAVAGARPALSGAKSKSSPFVENYLRKGMEAGVELKALGGTSEVAGGYAVPEEIDVSIDRVLTSISPIRAIANVVKVGSAGYRKLVTKGGTPSGWVSEDAARPETNTPDFVEIAPPFGELYANPAASQAMLDDAAFDVEGWLAQEIATEFARAEGAAFVSGTGINPPQGLPRGADFGTGGRGAGVRDFAVRDVGCGGRLCGKQSAGQADRPGSGIAAALPAGRGVRDEQRHCGAHPQVQDRGRRVPVAAGAACGAAGYVARLSGRGSGGHAGRGGGLPVHRLRQLQGRLPDRGADGDADPARSVHAQAVRTLLRHQARWRAGGEFGSDQAS